MVYCVARLIERQASVEGWISASTEWNVPTSAKNRISKSTLRQLHTHVWFINTLNTNTVKLSRQRTSLSINWINTITRVPLFFDMFRPICVDRIRCIPVNNATQWQFNYRKLIREMLQTASNTISAVFLNRAPSKINTGDEIHSMQITYNFSFYVHCFHEFYPRSLDWCRQYIKALP